MFELTNEQRKCFALTPVEKAWKRIEAKPSPNDNYKTYLYLDGNTIVKCIICGEYQYSEYDLSETVSDDGEFLMPKTDRGKPARLTSSAIQKRSGTGMHLNYHEKNINLYNCKTECSYFFNSYLDDEVNDILSFSNWVEKWCRETTDEDLADIERFSKQQRRRIRYNEGDVFRFKIGRRLYGYGRIILDYDKMRKNEEPFWDILMSKPVVCSVYHIVTERDDVSVSELQHLPSLPSTIIADNSLYYGEYEIIGNIPVTEHEDFPVMYGNSIDIRENAVCYQCGKTFRKIENGTVLYHGFINNGVAFSLNFTLNILMQCIKEKSNDPYWNLYYPHWVNRDLRNPKFQDKLAKIKQQFNLDE